MSQLIQLLEKLYGSLPVANNMAEVCKSELRHHDRSHLVQFLAQNDTTLSAREISDICDLTEKELEQAA